MLTYAPCDLPQDCAHAHLARPAVIAHLLYAVCTMCYAMCHTTAAHMIMHAQAYVFSLLHDVLGLPLHERSVLFTNTIPRAVRRRSGNRGAAGHASKPHDASHASEGAAPHGNANSAVDSHRTGISEPSRGLAAVANPDELESQIEVVQTVHVGLNWVVGAMLVEAMNGARHGSRAWWMRGEEGEHAGQGGGLPFGLPLGALLAIPIVLALLMGIVMRRQRGQNHQTHRSGAEHLAPAAGQLWPLPAGEELHRVPDLDLGRVDVPNWDVGRSGVAWSGGPAGEAKLRELERGAWAGLPAAGKAHPHIASRFSVEAVSSSAAASPVQGSSGSNGVGRGKGWGSQAQTGDRGVGENDESSASTRH